jgi:hypothetical protein
VHALAQSSVMQKRWLTCCGGVHLPRRPPPRLTTSWHLGIRALEREAKPPPPRALALNSSEFMKFCTFRIRALNCGTVSFSRVHTIFSMRSRRMWLIAVSWGNTSPSFPASHAVLSPSAPAQLLKPASAKAPPKTGLIRFATAETI